MPGVCLAIGGVVVVVVERAGGGGCWSGVRGLK